MDNAQVIDSTAVPVSNMALGNVLGIPAVRQIMLLVGVAGAVAAGLAVFLWSQTPSFISIYDGGDSAEAAEIASALRTANIEHKINSVDGSVLVDEGRLFEARMQLGSQGILTDGGLSSMDEGAFGRSAEVERSMLNQNLEAELARTISNLGAVREARVHLALPNKTSFIRDRQRATASVVLKTQSGRMLDPEQAAAISQLVATAVPNLSQSDVTIMDQHGRMLASGNKLGNEALAASQLKYRQSVEEDLRTKVEELLTPYVGIGKVRARVSADIDFSHREVASEEYDGANAAVVSRQISETNVSGGSATPGGVPGALTNQPPEAGGVTPTEAENVAAQNNSRNSTENLMVPKTLRYEKPQPATITRLSVSVLVDSTEEQGAEGAGLTQADIDEITEITQGVIGFDAARGDVIVVKNVPFRDRLEIEPVEAPAIWEKPIVRDIAKQVLGAAVVLAIVFGIVRPMLNNVVSSHAEGQRAAVALAAGGTVPAVAGGQAALAAPNFDDKVTAARNISGHDPARVAQVVKQWVEDNG